MQKRLFASLVLGLVTASGSLMAQQNTSPCTQDDSCSTTDAQSLYTDRQTTGQTGAEAGGSFGQEMGTRGTMLPSAKAGSSEAGALRANPATPVQPQFPPAPPSDFQKFVSATTGQRLSVYGADLFRKGASAFSASDLTPARADYLIGPDDELRIRVWGAVNYSGNLRVDRSGNIYIPQAGSVHVAGLKFAELDHQLRAAVARVYRNFDLNADLGRIRSIQVYVTGQARQPGMYTVSALSSLVDALFASGGPAPSGSLRHIQLKRDGKVVTDFDLYAFLLHGDKSSDANLQPEDVLYIPPSGAQVAVVGSVHNPAIYELREHETVAELLDAAGKISAMTSSSKVTLDRVENNQRRAVDFALDQTGLSVKLNDGDIVRVFSILPSYKNSVTLRGSVANAGHYGWHENMHLSELLPDRDALFSRDYWWKRSHLGLGTPEFESDVATADSLQTTLASTVNKPGNNLNVPTAAQSSGFSSIAQQAGNSEQTNQQQTPSNVVTVTPNQINWNYAVIERVDPVTFKTSLLAFDPGKLINEHDASQDLVLQAGDTVTIFSQSDIRVPEAEQTKYVTLEGEIVHAGTYSVNPGETLQDLVRRAGGLTPQAYLFGAEFDRESTRRLQQQRIDEYVRNVELETTRSSIAFANYATLSSQGGSSAPNSSIYQQFVEQLRKIRATGRVVLKIKPESKSVNDLPILALENGDRLIIPHRQSTINIVGSVYDQNTFLYEQDATVGHYLKLAGGPDRNADSKRAFVIRADGSVLNRETAKRVLGDNFLNARLNPGDTIVMPDRNYRPNIGLKSTLEWTTMFSQLAMGAATIALLK